MRIRFLLLFSLIVSPGTILAAEPSLCHAFIDFDFIWTLEVVRTRTGNTPILNVVTLASGEWEIQPEQIRLVDQNGTGLRIENFSIDLGESGEPVLTPYLKLRGGEFAGVDLVGDFSKLELVQSLEIDLGKDRFRLEPLDCDEFDELAGRIGEIEFASANLEATFQTLNLGLIGTREAR